MKRWDIVIFIEVKLVSDEESYNVVALMKMQHFPELKSS